MISEEKIDADAVAARVRGALVWRSLGQVAAQLITWTATFLVIRLLDPADYGLIAMTQVVLMFFTLLNGYGFASALIQREQVDLQQIRQVFGILLLLNVGLAIGQLLIAPLAAAYYREPMVADLLRAQAVIYLSMPFSALAYAMLSRRIDFKPQVQVNLLAALLSALTALGGALAGWGVWTLVVAPIVLFWTRAIGITIAARSLVWPSFRFAGAGDLLRYGGAMTLIQFFTFILGQADIFIGGRVLGAHQLGIYSTALFVAQIVTNKFVPPLNEVAFAGYSRLQGDREATAAAFVKSVRLIMLAALPCYVGLAVTAEPLVLTVLGTKWAEAIPILPILALAMPAWTLTALLGPATNGLGRPGIAIRSTLAGAAIMVAAVLLGVRFGVAGLAWAWLAATGLYALVTISFSLPIIGVGRRRLARALMPAFGASAAMGLAVLGLDRLLPPLPVELRFVTLVAAGVILYAGLLLAFARPLAIEMLALVRRRPAERPA